MFTSDDFGIKVKPSYHSVVPYGEKMSEIGRAEDKAQDRYPGDQEEASEEKLYTKNRT
jgi:hypothetical protein